MKRDLPIGFHYALRDADMVVRTFYDRMSPPPRPDPLPDARDILTVCEVAKDLRCSKAHVYKVINGTVAGVSPLPAIGMGRRRLVRRSTLEQWKRSNERAAGDGILIASLQNHAGDA
jgi:excisionase family DNA binding protein